MSSHWVPFRERKLGQPSKVEYGGVSWHPQYIPRGSDIEFDVEKFNRWLRSMSIEVPIEIVTYGTNNERPTPNISTINKNGEATVSSTKNHTPKQPHLWNILNSPEQETFKYAINFGGIVDFLQQKYPDLDPTKFAEEYSKLANIALKSGIPFIVIYNAVHLALENYKITGEVLIDGIAHIAELLTILLLVPAFTGTVELNIQRLLFIHLLYQTAFPAINIFIIGETLITKDKDIIDNKNSIFNYLTDANETPLIRFMRIWFPLLSMKYFTIPLLFAFTNKDQFIRPAQVNK